MNALDPTRNNSSVYSLLEDAMLRRLVPLHCGGGEVGSSGSVCGEVADAANSASDATTGGRQVKRGPGGNHRENNSRGPGSKVDRCKWTQLSQWFEGRTDAQLMMRYRLLMQHQP